MNESMIEINRKALKALDNGDEDTAQSLFRKNADLYPCCLTLHNLGLYYLMYGVITKNGKIRSAYQLGAKRLIEASLYEHTYLNCIAIATTAMKDRNFEYAYRFLIEASGMQSEDITRYNIGVCLYHMKRYEEALMIFSELVQPGTIARIEKNVGENPYIIMANCMLNIGDIEGCRNTVGVFRRLYPNKAHYDVFCLRFLCGDYESAMTELDPLLKKWFLTKRMAAMILSCDNDRLIQGKLREHIFGKSRDWLEMLIHDEGYRNDMIKQDEYVPPSIRQYYFMQE